MTENIYPPRVPNEFIANLPYDIKKYIYDEHFSYELQYKKLKNILDSIDCRTLIINEEYKNMICQILNDIHFINYLMKYDMIFKELYTKIFIHHKKNFINLNNDDDFALSWLFTLYH